MNWTFVHIRTFVKASRKYTILHKLWTNIPNFPINYGCLNRLLLTKYDICFHYKHIKLEISLVLQSN